MTLQTGIQHTTRPDIAGGVEITKPGFETNRRAPIHNVKIVVVGYVWLRKKRLSRNSLPAAQTSSVGSAPCKIPATQFLLTRPHRIQNEGKDRRRERTHHRTIPRQTGRRGSTGDTYMDRWFHHRRYISRCGGAAIVIRRIWSTVLETATGKLCSSYEAEMTAILMSLDYVTILDVAV